MTERPKLVLHSNAPWASTGYGQQCALFAPRLNDSYAVGISSFYGLEGARLNWNDMIVYPGMGGDFGNASLPAHAAAHFGGDLRSGTVLTLLDVWVLDPRIARSLNTACWVPVDHEPAPPRVTQFFEHSGAIPIAMSKFGAKMLSAYDPLYVPHGVDTKVYRPIPKTEARGFTGFPEDKFIVGMVAANKGNPSRKCFAEALTAFKAFHAAQPDSMLYLHTEMSGRFDGVNLGHLIEALGMPDGSVFFPDQDRLLFHPFSHSAMANVYSSLDVLLSPSAGEGFGLPVLEAAACFPAGTPVRVEDPQAVQCRPYSGKMVTIRTARGEFEVTADHPIWTDKGWRLAEGVRPEDHLLFSYAPKGLDQVHAGAIEHVAEGIRRDALEEGSRGGGDELRGGLFPTPDSRTFAEADFGAGRDEARGDERGGVALLRRSNRRRGHRHDAQDQSWAESEPHAEAVSLRRQHGQANDGLGYGARLGRLARHAANHLKGLALLPRVRRGPEPTPAIQASGARLGREERLDGGGYRVVRDPSISVSAGTLDDSAARDRVADPGTQYEPVEAIESRYVRDVPVYNFTTGSGLYEVGEGYLVHNCGVPSIVTDFSAQSEVCGAGWKVKYQPHWTPQESWQAKPDVQDILDALKAAHRADERTREQMAHQARSHAEQYDADLVTSKYFLPALEAVAARYAAREPQTLKAVAA